MINTLGQGLRHLIPAQLGLDVKQLAQQGPSHKVDMQAVNQIYDDLFRILEHGLGTRQNRPEARGTQSRIRYNYLKD